VSAIDEHRKPNRAWATVVKEGVDRRAHRASGKENVIDKDDDPIVERRGDVARSNERVRKAPDVVAVERDVELGYVSRAKAEEDCPMGFRRKI